VILLAERSFDFAQYEWEIKGLVMRLEDYKWEEDSHSNNLIEFRYKSCQTHGSNSVKSSRLILTNTIKKINKVIKFFIDRQISVDI